MKTSGQTSEGFAKAKEMIDKFWGWDCDKWL